MGYLSNRTINHLNIQSALLSLLELAFGTFAPVYFYEQGFSLPEVFFLLALFNAARLPLRLLSFPIVRLVGLKAALMIGAAGFCLSFPILILVKGYDIWLAAYILIFGMFNALYWHCFHTFYSMAGDLEHRGKHLSISQALSTAVSALAPLLGALFIIKSGFHAFFLLPIPLMLGMMLVLGRCENAPAHRTSWQEGKKLMFSLGARMHLAEASAVFPLSIGWLFVVYLFSKHQLEIVGGVVTFGMIIQIIYQLWLGRMMDRGAGGKIAHIAGSLRFVQTILKALLPLSLPRIFTLEALTGATSVHQGLSQATVMYNDSKSSIDPFWYWLFAETAFDLGSILGAGSVAILLLLGVPVQLTILAALPGITAVWFLTSRYFARLSAAKAM